MNFSTKEQLKMLPLKARLSLIFNEPGIRQTIDFKTIFKADESSDENPYDTIRKISNTFVTTNYEEWNVFFKQEDFLNEKNHEKTNAVFHIHGSVQDPEEMVITTRDYILRYSNEEGIPKFLKWLFSAKRVLFMGYGLEELEILEYVLTKQKPTGEAKHFIIEGFYSHEEKREKWLEKYFLSLGIRLISYSKDEKEYRGLFDKLQEIAPLNIDKLVEMENLLDE